VDMFKQFDCNNLQHVDNQENSIKNRVDVIANIFAKQPILSKNQLETYAELSKRFSLLPVNPKSKVAAIKKWPERCSKKVDFSQYHYITPQGQIMNAGIACGSASGVIVLDIDDVNQFNEWCKSKSLSNPIPETFTVESGGKSQHYYFKYPNNGKEYRKCKIPGADIIGIGGYVVAPGSIHPSGKQYYISKDIPVVEAPEWLLDVMLNKLSDKKHEVKPVQEVVLAETTPETISNMINEGERNNQLKSIAGALLNTKLSHDAIKAALIEHNRTRCNPPLNLDEVEQIYNSTINYTITQAIILTHQGYADYFVNEYQNIIRYNFNYKEWFIWNNQYWESDKAGRIYSFLKECLRKMYNYGKTINTDFGESLKKTSRQYENSPHFENIIKRAQNDNSISVSSDKFNKHPMKLTCINGTIDLTTGELLPHNHLDLITKMISIEYNNDSKCPIFKDFINNIMGGNVNLINYLQKIFGYILTGDTKEQCYFIFYGSGGNGKGTLLNIFREILGVFHTDISFKSLINNNDRAQHDMFQTIGVRMLTVSEIDPDKIMDETLINRITGCDPITVKQLYSNKFNTIPQFKLIISGNHYPCLQSMNYATKRRIRLIPFTQKYEGINNDKNLIDKLKCELSGILRWAIEGCIKKQQEGFEPPAEVISATQEYIEDIDSVGCFIESECDTGNIKYNILSSQFNILYNKWCENNGEKPLGKKGIKTALQDKLYTKSKKNGQEYWFGLQVKETDNSFTQEEPVSEQTNSIINDVSQSNNIIMSYPDDLKPYEYEPCGYSISAGRYES